MEIISDSIVGTIVLGMGGVGKITEKHLPEPHPAYVKAERIKKARNFQLLLTAANVSDHSDLQDDAAAAVLSVAEVTGSNVVLVAEDKLMRILLFQVFPMKGRQWELMVVDV
ncbi:formate dehydrogenase, chloroplastic/mitochondrial-like [Mangifera indica]|uniref:formate dehydrogenase, chloroplastic/mitochondrial-like n=1 Tax=Mangifera indica TaxID=29780 RepID=UPI001CFA9E18|nr:formate dehydrogenase, chloroplastic/mitochondrial-like [Mangifera indica]